MGGTIDRLQSFIENILYWGFRQTDRMTINKRDLPLQPLVEGLAYRLRYDTEAKGQSIKQEIPPGFTLNADENSIKVVLRNLLSNAVKFTPEGGDITLTAKETEKGIEISVSNPGKGIPKERLNQLFRQGETTEGTSGEEGTGLGLWLCQEMTELNGGSIQAESEVDGMTHFILRFPK